MSTPHKITGDASPDIEMLRIVPLSEASRLSNLSIDGLKRHHSDKIISMSERRRGMRVRDALMINGDAA
jgi:hypothetical protein